MPDYNNRKIALSTTRYTQSKSLFNVFNELSHRLNIQNLTYGRSYEQLGSTRVGTFEGLSGRSGVVLKGFPKLSCIGICTSLNEKSSTVFLFYFVGRSFGSHTKAEITLAAKILPETHCIIWRLCYIL